MENVNCLRCHFRHEDNGNCTEVGGFCTAVPAAHCPLLRQYLDTGLTPKRCAEFARADAEGRYIVMRDAEQEGVARLRELAEADKDGRLVVLPCKVGDTVYEVTSRKTISEYRIRAIRVELFALFIEWKIEKGFVDKSISGVVSDEIGKTVFLTREEAEKALEVQKND